MQKAFKSKNTKTGELKRQSKTITKDISDLTKDCIQLAECKEVLENELTEENAYQDQIRTLIAQLKWNIYEIKGEREKVIKDTSKGKKILTNLQSMKEVVVEDKQSLQRDFERAMDRSTNGGPSDDCFMSPFQGKSLSMIIQSGTKSNKKSTGKKQSTSKKPLIASKMKPLKF